MSASIAFIICTEPGRLEKQSLLLVESIRKFGGNLKDTPIYSFHPRQDGYIADSTQSAFQSLGVIHDKVLLNIKYHDYYLANKPYVCAYAESQIDADILVFLDSDKCFFAEPKEFFLPENFLVGVRPEYGRGIGSTGKQDSQDSYWQKLYEVLNVQNEIFVETPIGSKIIRAYWNSGLIVTKRKAGIFQAWKNNFEKLMELNIAPAQGIYFVEQSSLAATICSQLKESEIFTLTPQYSYALPLHNRLSKPYKIKNFDEIVSIHYFNMFAYDNWQKKLNDLRGINKKSEKYTWLCNSIVRYDMPFEKVSHDYILKLRRIEQKLSTYKIKINFSHWLEKKLIK